MMPIAPYMGWLHYRADASSSIYDIIRLNIMYLQPFSYYHEYICSWTMTNDMQAIMFLGHWPQIWIVYRSDDDDDDDKYNNNSNNNYFFLIIVFVIIITTQGEM